MADIQTVKVLRHRTIAKRVGFAGFGMAIGLGLKLAINLEPISLFLSLFENVVAVIPSVQQWLDAYPDVRGWVVGPLTFGFVFWLVAGKWFRRTVLDKLFPNPPPFVRSDLTAARRRDRLISLEGPPLPFVGRSAELAELEELFGSTGQAFAWRAITGPSGIGKTRLGIEWLEKARAKGWDVGILDRDDFHLVKGWKTRRPTALVIDEARRDWDARLGKLLTALAKAGCSKRPVRALILDQAKPFVEVWIGDDRALVTSAEVRPPLRLRELEDTEIASLWMASPHRRIDMETVVRESYGRPRAALILINALNATSYLDALIEWVERFVPGLADPSQPMPEALGGPLFLAALAGPIDTDVARELFGRVDAAALERFYQNESSSSLEQRIPALTPDDLAQELVLRLFNRLDRRSREAAVDRMIRDLPARVEARLGGLWRERRDLGVADVGEGSLELLQWLQQRFQVAHPHRLRQVQEAAVAIADAVVDPKDRSSLDGDFSSLADIADSYPLDPVIRHAEGVAGVNATYHYGHARVWNELERWALRLKDIAAHRRFEADVTLRTYEAAACVNALTCYGAARNFEALERWGKRLLEISLDARFEADREMRLQLVKGAGGAMLHYGAIQEFETLERWAECLMAAIDDQRFADCPEIALGISSAAVNATSHYGAAHRFEDLERWGAVLVRIAGAEPFADNLEIRVAEAQGMVNIIEAYCSAGNLSAAQAWEIHLIALVEDERFAALPEMRLNEAMAAVNVIGYCAASAQFDRLEQWGARLRAIAEDDRLASVPEIRLREAKSAVNAINCYGAARDFGGVERWGLRLMEVVEDRRFDNDLEMRLLQAEGAVNANIYYGEARDFEAMERWGMRVVHLAHDPRFESAVEMRRLEAEAAVNSMRSYGLAGDLTEIERWGELLTSLGDDARFARDATIADLDAMGTNNAMFGYANARRQDWPRAIKWRARLARLARSWPASAEVQSLAAEYGLTAVSQLLHTRG